MAALAALAAALLGGAAWLRTPPAQGPVAGLGARRVVVVGLPHVGLGDLAHMPALARLARQGAVAAMNVRTVSARPRTLRTCSDIGRTSSQRTSDLEATRGWYIPLSDRAVNAVESHPTIREQPLLTGAVIGLARALTLNPRLIVADV